MCAGWIGRRYHGGMSLDRLVDAALNRAGEGLRTLEDLARFILDDSKSSHACKRLRHDLRGVAEDVWMSGRPCWSRDTAGDVGTTCGTPSESIRRGAADLAAAAGRRASEALRTLEESAKLEHGDEGSRAIEGIRYALYDLAAAI